MNPTSPNLTRSSSPDRSHSMTHQHQLQQSGLHPPGTPHVAAIQHTLHQTPSAPPFGSGPKGEQAHVSSSGCAISWTLPPAHFLGLAPGWSLLNSVLGRRHCSLGCLHNGCFNHSLPGFSLKLYDYSQFFMFFYMLTQSLICHFIDILTQ